MRLRIGLWSYRGISPVNQPTPMVHEYCGIIEDVGNAVRTALRLIRLQLCGF